MGKHDMQTDIKMDLEEKGYVDGSWMSSASVLAVFYCHKISSDETQAIALLGGNY
jgi:hypothetical protein